MQKCGKCRTKIPAGTNYVTVAYQTEQREGNDVNVQQADMAVVWCTDCAPPLRNVVNAVQRL